AREQRQDGTPGHRAALRLFGGTRRAVSVVVDRAGRVPQVLQAIPAVHSGGRARGGRAPGGGGRPRGGGLLHSPQYLGGEPHARVAPQAPVALRRRSSSTRRAGSPSAVRATSEERAGSRRPPSGLPRASGGRGWWRRGPRPERRFRRRGWLRR